MSAPRTYAPPLTAELVAAYDASIAVDEAEWQPEKRGYRSGQPFTTEAGLTGDEAYAHGQALATAANLTHPSGDWRMAVADLLAEQSK